MPRGVAVLDRDLGWRQIRRSLVKQFGSTEVDVEAFIPGDPAQEGTIAHYAATNEYGSADGHVPERSFIRATFTARRSAYEGALVRAVTRAVGGSLDRGSAIAAIEASLERLGLVVVGDIQQAIADGIAPPNAPSTIRQKGSSTPLIDTGALRQAITSRITQRQRGKLRAPKAGR